MTQIIECRDLGRKLPDMSPTSKVMPSESSDHVDYIDYRFEIARLDSFVNWTVPFMDPKKLAAAGFYYTGEGDKVRCFECRTEMCQWAENDDPMVDHQRWSARCRFIRNIPCGNVPIGVDPNTIPPVEKRTRDSCGLYGVQCQPNSTVDVNVYFVDSSPSVIELDELRTSKHPEYATYENRLRSFMSWPTKMIQTKEEMARAGFFYAGKSDETCCYYCGGGLKDWEPTDNPIQEHVKWFSKCKYIIKVQKEEESNNSDDLHMPSTSEKASI